MDVLAAFHLFFSHCVVSTPRSVSPLSQPLRPPPIRKFLCSSISRSVSPLSQPLRQRWISQRFTFVSATAPLRTFQIPDSELSLAAFHLCLSHCAKTRSTKPQPVHSTRSVSPLSQPLRQRWISQRFTFSTSTAPRRWTISPWATRTSQRFTFSTSTAPARLRDLSSRNITLAAFHLFNTHCAPAILTHCGAPCNKAVCERRRELAPPASRRASPLGATHTDAPHSDLRAVPSISAPPSRSL